MHFCRFVLPALQAEQHGAQATTSRSFFIGRSYP
ncbi:MAG: hypothetical protein ACI9M6_000553, partial [Hydrogenophaga sp.]